MTPNPNNLKRLFFALQAKPDCQQHIIKYQQQCQLVVPRAKATTASNLHLTLYFMGLNNAEQTHALQQAAATIQAPAIKLMLDKSGHFKKPKIFWLGCTHRSDSLMQLFNQLRRVIQPYVKAPMSETLVPHVSLFRKFSADDLSLNMPPLSAISFTANRFVLMESISTDHGVQYQPIQSYTLG